MKNIILKILEKYLSIYPEEIEKINIIKGYLNNYNNEEITDWNNFNGHIVAGGFIYNEKTNMFLVLYHKDLQMFLYPGGHVDKNDKTPLEAAVREVTEETGLYNIEQIVINNDELTPIDIDIHKAKENTRLNLPSHYHYDFRYLFKINDASIVTIDESESSEYKWISEEELEHDSHYGHVVQKIRKYIK